MDTTLYQEEENKKKGLIASVIFHAALVLLCILPLLTFPTPPPGQAGVLVSFGEPDVGQDKEEPGPSTIAEGEPVEVEEPSSEPEVETEKEVEEVKEKPKPKDPVKDNTKKVNTDENSKEIALKKKKAKEKKIKDAADKKVKDAAAAKAAKAAKKKADAAKAAAAAKAKKEKEFNDAKSSIGDLFNSNNGQGSGTNSQGTSGTPGNAGNPDGDPDATRLDGLGKGSGDVSGFGNRGFDRPGAITGNFQEIGTVNIKVCVDEDGKVTSATPKLSGSTTQSSKLQRLAIANAKKYKFDKSDSGSQCGTITYKFKLQ
ncbi:MAG: colicin import membrane protein [Patescibacteria group bacterium]|jgi:colicin import membrane protein